MAIISAAGGAAPGVSESETIAGAACWLAAKLRKRNHEKINAGG
jgi:hypothetical protein